MSVCSVSLCLFVFLVASVTLPPPFTSLQHNLADPPSSQHSPHHTSSLRNQTLPFRTPSFATEELRFAILAEKSCCCCLSVDPFVFFFFWWLLLASPLPSLPSTTTSQIDISPPPTIPHTTRHLWETKHSRFGSRVLQQKIFVWQFCPKCVCLLLSVGKIALLVCWGSVVCVCSVSLISGQIQMLQNPPKTSKNTEIHK